MSELISVIVPIFRMEKYLSGCVESICRQTYRNIEIVLVDDGSDDGCPAICDAYAEKDRRVKVIHKENGGLSDARNAGIDIAQGRYLAFVDSDDVVSEHFVEYLYRALKESSADISQCSFSKFCDAAPVYAEEYAAPEIYEKMKMLEYLSAPEMNICTIVAWSKLYRAELFSEIRFPRGKLHEDEFTTYRLLDRCSRIAYLDMPLYGYFQNPQGIIHAKVNLRRLDLIEALLERYRYYVMKGYGKLKKTTADQIVVSLLVYEDPRLDIVEPEAFYKRCDQLYREFRRTVCYADLDKRYQLIMRCSGSYKMLCFYYELYLKVRKVLKR